jgi:succinate semialdehyde reductase|tara:strand:- start:1239 stop:2183 length:945 start_codon:yes stop_codon:yes gene_type:complete
MFSIKQPKEIIFGKNSAHVYKYPENSLVITSHGAKKRNWIEYLQLKNHYIFDNVEPNPSIDITTSIINEFNSTNFATIIGVGGGSCLDVAKFVAAKLNKKKILVPTTFGSGSDLTRISVLKVDGKKRSFHDDSLFADVSITDSNFLLNTPDQIKKNSAIDACAQCSEAFDSKSGNKHTKFLCKIAFENLENGIISNNDDQLVFGSILSGLGFGNCSTTLGHALSYVFSNEGISHGHALAYTTTIAHEFNNSEFYERFLKIVKKLGFSKIKLKQDVEKAASMILEDKKHLDNNPKPVTKNDIVKLLESINSQNEL